MFFREITNKELSECWQLSDIAAMLNMGSKNFFKMQDFVVVLINKIEVDNILLGVMTKDQGITKLSRDGGYHRFDK